MPVEPRPSDSFTKDNLLIGFSVVEFTPALAGGGFGTPIQVGILGGEELQKEVELIQLQRGDSGTLTVDRELISSVEVTMQLEVFNFRADIAALIFGAPQGTPQTADPAKVVTDEQWQLANNGVNSERTFIDLANADLNESSFIGTSITSDTFTDESVGTGDGTSGAVSGDFALKYKPLDGVADIASVTVGGVPFTPVTVFTAGNEVIILDGTGATSGDMQFGIGGVASNVTGAILATYTPSHAFANLTDYQIDPTLGRIRMLDVDGATDALRAGQPMLADYDYNQKDAVDLKVFTQTQIDGKCTIKHLTDIGINFIWTVPSATILITDDALTFGAEEFGTAVLALNVNDAGGTDRFGTLELSSETQANT